MDSLQPNKIKEDFFEKNAEFCELGFKQISVGDVQNITDDNHELWLLQCPKNMSITRLSEQKLKLPGRTNCGIVETIAIDFDTAKLHAMGYVSRKRKKCLRLLPIRGTIVLRSRLVGKKSVDAVAIPSLTRVPMPDVKARHPLLGNQFLKKSEIHRKTVDKLQRADENNLKILRASWMRSEKSDVDKEYTPRKAEKKLNYGIPIKKPKCESLSPNKEENQFNLSDDLQWLQNV